MAIYRNEPALNDYGNLASFPGNSSSFKFKQKIPGSTGNDSTEAIN